MRKLQSYPLKYEEVEMKFTEDTRKSFLDHVRRGRGIKETKSTFKDKVLTYVTSTSRRRR